MSRPQTLRFLDVVVAQNASLSAAVDTGSDRIMGVIAPGAIEATTTNISFAAATSLAGTYKIVKPDGVKVTYPFAVSDYITFATPVNLFGIRFVKLQLETAAGVAVAQATAARTFTLILAAI